MKTVELKILLDDMIGVLNEINHSEEKLEKKRKNLLILSNSLREDLI